MPRLEQLETRIAPAGTVDLWIGGKSGNAWYDAANWSNGLPTATSTVEFDGRSTGAVMANPGKPLPFQTEVANLIVSPGYSAPWCIINLKNTSLIITSSLKMSAGTIDGGGFGRLIVGNVANNVDPITVDWKGGTLQNLALEVGTSTIRPGFTDTFTWSGGTAKDLTSMTFLRSMNVNIALGASKVLMNSHVTNYGTVNDKATVQFVGGVSGIFFTITGPSCSLTVQT